MFQQKSESIESAEFSPAQLGAIAHLYRAEVYRSTVWRTRLDTTTNWSVVTLGIAISVSYASPGASAIPLLLVGLLVVFFLMLEARRYLYFNVWRARCRWLETNLYAPILEHDDAHEHDPEWQRILARDYYAPRYHISYLRAVGRRLRRSYIWILLIQSVAYLIKITIHPVSAATFAEVVDRAAVGPLSGGLVLTFGLIYNGFWIAIALYTLYLDRVTHGGKRSAISGG